MLELADRIKDPKMKLKFLELRYHNQKTEEVIPLEHIRALV